VKSPAVTRRVPVRPDLSGLDGYHSPQVDVEVRLNTNESPFPPPDAWLAELRQELGHIPFQRYPDREQRALREALGGFHGVGPERVFCANGSSEVLQSLLLAYGGPGRRAAVFEPTYTLHRHIASLTGTEVVSAWRTADHRLDWPGAEELLARHQPLITFLCSPNNPTGRAEPPDTIRAVLGATTGLVVVDEAYGQFAPHSALDLIDGADADTGRLVVVRTFSKTWSMAACRLGYLVADPEIVSACELVALPYHLDAFTQVAGRLALRHGEAMRRRVAQLTEERGRMAATLAELPVESWPSDANFILFRPLARAATDVWSDLLAESVLIRDCSGWAGLQGCLRVTVGTPAENDRFLAALRRALGAAAGGSGTGAAGP
jgi:histidinol-phosphate aminotransferase